MEISYTFKNDLQETQKQNIEYCIRLIPNIELEYITFTSNAVSISLNGGKHSEEYFINLLKNFDSSFNLKTESIYFHDNLNKMPKSTIYESLISKQIIFKEMDGVYLYFGLMNKLYIALKNYFRKKMLELGAEEVYLPSLLSADTLNKSDYIETNHQICNYVYHEGNSDIDFDGILNPAACQPIYKCFKFDNKEERIITGFARVYRYEGSNYKELSRLREYGITELVYVSTAENVENFKTKCIKKVIEMIEELDLKAEITTATDMFFDSSFISKSIYQLSTQSKLELKLWLTDEERTAACSINNHNQYFAKKWDLKFKNGEYKNTLCIGFGIERWCFAILCQYGDNEERWPIKLKNLIDEYCGV